MPSGSKGEISKATNAYAKAITDFELSVTRALKDQLSECLRGLCPAPLDDTALATVENRGGIYILYLDEEQKYLGKAAKTLRARLRNHHDKLSGRVGIDMKRVMFIAAYVNEDLDAVAPETLLIKELVLPWNSNGFGNKDPGKKRDGTRVKRGHFDATFPIRLEYRLPERESWGANLGECLAALKGALPFTLRYAAEQNDLRIYKGLPAPVIGGGTPAGDAFMAVIECLPPDWQLTALPGYAILYPDLADYPSAMSFWRKAPGGHAVRFQGRFQLADDADEETTEVIEEDEGEEAPNDD